MADSPQTTPSPLLASTDAPPTTRKRPLPSNDQDERTPDIDSFLKQAHYGKVRAHDSVFREPPTRLWPLREAIVGGNRRTYAASSSTAAARRPTRITMPETRISVATVVFVPAVAPRARISPQPASLYPLPSS